MSNIIEGSDGPSLDFGSISARVSEHLSSLETSNSPSPTPGDTSNQVTQDHPAQQVQRTQQAVEQPSESVDGKGSQPSEYTLPDGTKATAEEIAAWRKGHMLQSDYTRKTQEIAEMRKASEQVFQAYKQMEQERQELVEFLNNPTQIAQYLAQQYGANQLNPDMVPTIGDVQQLTQHEIARVQQQLSQLQQQFQQQLAETAQQTREQITYEAQEAHYVKQIDNEFGKIFEEFPLLKALPNAEHNIRFEVFQANPESDEQMFSALWETAQKYVDNIERTYSELNKSKMTRAESLTQNNTQPPGGTGIQPEPAKSRYNAKTNQMSWKDIQNDAISYMKSRQ